jgi:hypothetical protein
VLVTHARRVSLFSAGRGASAGVQAIAEDGNPAVAAAMLQGVRGVYDIVTTSAPVHRIGGPGPNVLQARITTDGEHDLLSFASMLICTNDGFAGVNGVRLPRNDQPQTVYAHAYDAGTEANTEVAGDIVPPCFGIGPVSGLVGGSGHRAEQRVVRAHSGIRNEADLARKLHGWQGPVAMISIQRVSGTP